MTERPSHRQAIVAASTELIRTHGVQGTSVSDIIAASGTSTGSIYHHFPNKHAIVIEVARQAIAWPLEALEEYRNHPASPAQVFSFAVAALTDDPHRGDLLVQLGAGAATDDKLGRALRHELGLLRDSVDETIQAWAKANGVPTQRVHGYSQLLIGLILGFVSQRRLIGNFDETTYTSQGSRLLSLGADGRL